MREVSKQERAELISLRENPSFHGFMLFLYRYPYSLFPALFAVLKSSGAVFRAIYVTIRAIVFVPVIIFMGAFMPQAFERHMLNEHKRSEVYRNAAEALEKAETKYPGASERFYQALADMQKGVKNGTIKKENEEREIAYIINSIYG